MGHLQRPRRSRTPRTLLGCLFLSTVVYQGGCQDAGPSHQVLARSLQTSTTSAGDVPTPAPLTGPTGPPVSDPPVATSTGAPVAQPTVPTPGAPSSAPVSVSTSDPVSISSPPPQASPSTAPVAPPTAAPVDAPSPPPVVSPTDAAPSPTPVPVPATVDPVTETPETQTPAGTPSDVPAASPVPATGAPVDQPVAASPSLAPSGATAAPILTSDPPVASTALPAAPSTDAPVIPSPGPVASTTGPVAPTPGTAAPAPAPASPPGTPSVAPTAAGAIATTSAPEGPTTPSPVNPALVGTAAPVVPSTCSNGQPGYQDDDVCCLEACGQCGGEGCGTIPGTGGASNCCSSTIRENGVVCGEPPCIIAGYTPPPAVVGGGTPAPDVQYVYCDNGIPGFQDDGACCEPNCRQCGGVGCGSIPGTGGSSSCCSDTIRSSGQYCSVVGEAPCIVDGYTPSPANPAYSGTTPPYAPSNCSIGIPGVQNGAACCVESCGQCGGIGCGSIPGTGGSSNCCASDILAANQFCYVNGRQAPCVIEGYTPAPAGLPGTVAPYAPSTCSNGFPGVQDGAVCCAENCGQCGGAGCGTLPGTGGSDYCCSGAIAENGTSCSVSGEAPCFIEGWVPTPAPITAAPVEPSTCSNGLPGVQDGYACCKMSCGLCGGPGCGAIPGTNGAYDCCSSTILMNNQTCGNGIVAPCVIAETLAPTSSPTITPNPAMAPTDEPENTNARDIMTSAAPAQYAFSGVIPMLTAAAAAFFGMAVLGVRNHAEVRLW